MKHTVFTLPTAKVQPEGYENPFDIRPEIVCTEFTSTNQCKLLKL